MDYESDIKELLKHSSSEIKGNKALFSDFVRLYIADGGNSSDCMGCSFNNTFNKWRDRYMNPNKINRMISNKNTFKLKQPNKLYHDSIGNYVFSKRSSDETAIKWILDHKGIYKTERELVFTKLPTDYNIEEVKPKKRRRKKTEDN